MFRVDRAAAMSAFFLEREDGRMNDIKLAKLQYLSERKSLLDLLSPIVNDDGVSLYHGPCLSQTLFLTNDTHIDSHWDSYIGFEPYDLAPEKNNMVVLLSQVPISDALSPADVEILSDVWRQFGQMDSNEIKRWCHEHLAEYTRVGYGEREWISLVDIFRAAGDDFESAHAKADEVRYQQRFEAEHGYKAVGLF